MRVAVVGTLGLVLLCACASDKLALAPPAGVDLSGHWQLNDAESDDPLRLTQSQVDPSKVTTGPGQGQGGQGRGGGGGGGRQGRGGGFGGGGGGSQGPVMPGMNTLREGLRWPGKDVEIKQVAGVVAITSGGLNQVYQPASFDKKKPRHHKPQGDGPRGRDMPDRDRGDGPPAVCGWDDKTLVVQGSDPDEGRPLFEQRYSVSADGQRLFEVVGFKEGRSAGFTVSRTWDRVVPGAPGMAAPGVPPAGTTSRN
jgi:hypothetical protein